MHFHIVCPPCDFARDCTRQKTIRVLIVDGFSNHDWKQTTSWKTADTEVYNFVHGFAQNVTVLSYAYDSTAVKRMWPVEWTVAYGKGRVYNSSMGHLWPATRSA